MLSSELVSVWSESGWRHCSVPTALAMSSGSLQLEEHSLVLVASALGDGDSVQSSPDSSVQSYLHRGHAPTFANHYSSRNRSSGFIQVCYNIQLISGRMLAFWPIY